MESLEEKIQRLELENSQLLQDKELLKKENNSLRVELKKPQKIEGKTIIWKNSKKKVKLEYHVNQLEAANLIFDKYRSGTNHVLLHSRTQCGKTKTSKRAAKTLYEEGLISQVYFICGMNDNDLKTQIIKDFKSCGTFNDTNFKCLFSKDLQKHVAKMRKGTIGKIGSKTMIILDESHFAQNMINLVQKFFAENDISLNGFCDRLVDRKIYILTVSATPYSELANFYNNKGFIQKDVIVLKAGENYYGHKNMIDAGKMFQSQNFTKDASHPAGIVQNFISRNVKGKAFIIRVSSKSKTSLERALTARSLTDRIHFIDYFYKTRTDVMNDILDSGLNRNKLNIIYIYHSFRAGYSLNTENICGVYEAPSSGATKTDIAVQGLAGRSTGYYKANHAVEIYVDKQTIVNWLKSEEEGKIPDYCRNVVSTNNKTLKDTNCMIPLELDINGTGFLEYINVYFKDVSVVLRQYSEINDILIEYLDENTDGLLEVTKTLNVRADSWNSLLKNVDFGTMYIDHKNSDRSYKDYVNRIYENHYNGTPIPGFDLKDKDKMIYFYISDDRTKEERQSTQGKLYICAQSKKDTNSVNTFVETTTKENTYYIAS